MHYCHFLVLFKTVAILMLKSLPFLALSIFISVEKFPFSLMDRDPCNMAV